MPAVSPFLDPRCEPSLASDRSNDDDGGGVRPERTAQSPGPCLLEPVSVSWYRHHRARACAWLNHCRKEFGGISPSAIVWARIDRVEVDVGLDAMIEWSAVYHYRITSLPVGGERLCRHSLLTGVCWEKPLCGGVVVELTWRSCAAVLYVSHKIRLYNPSSCDRCRASYEG